MVLTLEIYVITKMFIHKANEQKSLFILA